jgi:hypothetical protein
MVRKRDPSERSGKAFTYVCVALAGVVSLAIGLFWLAHPFGGVWAPGEAHRAELPPVWGGILVVPVFLIGLVAYRTWWTLELDLEAWRERRRKRRSQASSH